MPRAKGENRGGARQGTPGKAYSNRTDLNGTQPVQAGPSQGYGQRAALERMQQAVPLPQARPAATPAAPQAAPPTPPPTPPDFFAPTARPDQPVTAGLSTGEGPGPEILGLPMEEPGMANLAKYLPVLELAASRPGSSEQLRNFVRRVRGNVTS